MPQIKRTKSRLDWSTEEILRHQRDGTEPISEEWLAAKKAAMEKAELEPDEGDSSGGNKAVADMTGDEVLAHVQEQNRR